MSAKTPLKKLLLFWCALGIPLALSILCAGIIVYSESPLFFCGTATCFDFAFSMFKVPVAIATLALPCVTLVVANHRSEQSIAQLIKADAQLEKSELQLQANYAKNSFDNFYKHQEHFSNFINSIKGNLLIDSEFNNSTGLYKKIFINNKVTSFSPVENGYNELKRVIEELIYIDELLTNEITDDSKIEEVYLAFKVIFESLNIHKIKVVKEEINVSYKMNYLSEEHRVQYFSLVIREHILDILEEIYSFSSDFKFTKNEFNGAKEFYHYENWSNEYRARHYKEKELDF